MSKPKKIIVTQEQIWGVPVRKRLPDTRTARTHKFKIYTSKETAPDVFTPITVKGYLTMGEYEDGTLGEIFVRVEKEHAKLAALLDQFAIAISMLLQVGQPLELLCQKFQHTRFEPAGRTANPDIPSASSPIDYIFAYLRRRYVDGVRMEDTK
jgi:ribonucleoside-diphosphate reductase alpha chain